MSIEEMSLDEFETCFFRDEMDEDFYEDSSSKDLFKKFELLTPPQTPPQSPPHNPFPPDGRTSIKTSVHACLEEVRSRINPIVECDESISSDLSSSLPDDYECSINLVANLIQDCMWSGPCLAAAGLLSPDSIKPKKILKDITQKNHNTTNSCTEIHSGQCVDPAAVFPYQAETVKKLETVSFNLGSVAETPSPSESEDEEIDVVTVVAEKMARRRQMTNSTSAVNSLNVHRNHLASIHNYHSTNSPPKSHSAPQSPQVNHHRDNLHSYAGSGHKRSRPTSMPPSPQPTKKQRSLLHQTDLKRVAQKLKMGHVPTLHLDMHHELVHTSRSSSDSEEGEDTNKRAQHNVLERKRRNDLKYSFLRLRDNVPDLAKQDRSPKVTILKLSSDFIHSIVAKNRRLENEYARVKARHEHMQQQLSMLRRECL